MLIEEICQLVSLLIMFILKTVFHSNLWDAVTGEEKASFAHNHIVKAVAFSPDCKKLLTGGQEKQLRSFDVEKVVSGKNVTALDSSSLCIFYAF